MSPYFRIGEVRGIWVVTRQKVKLHVYKISRWGIYGTEKNQVSPKCSGIKETLDDLYEWAVMQKKPLRESSTYSSSADLLKSYMWGMHQDTGTEDWVISLWNEVENKNGKVLYAPSKDAVGQAKATSAKVANDMIPGFPSLFWVLPRLNLLVCIVPEDRRLSGIRQFEGYIYSFIEFFSRYVIKDNDDPKIRVGLSETPRGKGEDKRVQNDKLHVALYVSPQRRPGHFDKLLDSAEKVRKIIKKVDVKTMAGRSEYERGLFYFARHALKLTQDNIPATARKTFKLEIPVQLTKADIQRAIDEYVSGNDAKLLDVGYKIEGEQNPIFLSGSRVVEEVSIPYHTKPDGTSNLSMLMSELLNHREDLKSWIV